VFFIDRDKKWPLSAAIFYREKEQMQVEVI